MKVYFEYDTTNGIKIMEHFKDYEEAALKLIKHLKTIEINGWFNVEKWATENIQNVYNIDDRGLAIYVENPGSSDLDCYTDKESINEKKGLTFVWIFEGICKIINNKEEKEETIELIKKEYEKYLNYKEDYIKYSEWDVIQVFEHIIPFRYNERNQDIEIHSNYRHLFFKKGEGRIIIKPFIGTPEKINIEKIKERIIEKLLGEYR